jgi:two-component system cell cycle sensor histidine kinase/response regulator CckA
MVLLVEDDAICRMDFARQLRSNGYEVLEAGDGAEAIELLEQHYNEIELVVTDLALPKVNGFDVVTNVQRRWPKIPMIMISGYLSEDRGHAILGSTVDILRKPFHPNALIALAQRMSLHKKQS